MTLYRSAERSLKSTYEVYLKQQLRLFGKRLKVIRLSKDVHQEVYGIESGEQSGESYWVMGLVTPVTEDFEATSEFEAGTFTEGWLYTQDQVEVGSVLEFDERDQVRRYYVLRKEGIGATEEVMARYRISSQTGVGR